MIFHSVCELTVVSQCIVEFLIISYDISSSGWVNCHLSRYCWIWGHLTWHFVQSVSWPSSCKVLLNFSSPHMIFVQLVSQLLACKVLLNFWPSGIAFSPVCELTVISQGIVEYLPIWHDICPVCEWTIVLQGVVEFLTILHHISSSLWVILWGDVEFLTILHQISSREWVNHCLTRHCSISDHLMWHFI